MKLAKLVVSPKLWFMGTALSLMTIHLSLALRFGSSELSSISVLFWSIVLYQLWKKRRTLCLEGVSLSRFLGIAVIAAVLIKSICVSSDDPFLQISPFLSVLGLGLLTSGIGELKQYRKELFILFMLALPVKEILSRLLDVATLTAKLATSLLGLLGFNVSRQGVYIILPPGFIEVIPSCDGTRSMARMLKIAVFF
ncbi:MAG: cyanoexosortase A [Chroococcidiopsidaceae cyanobacterium CP_BM_RX_35]|nr:cyanoexosortase A [Chroococcidiopsidaceae cyanobacterium CP_BM_RX_35]